MRSQVRVSAGSPQAGWPGHYINVRRCGGLSLALLQLKDPLQLFVESREILSGYQFLSRPLGGLPRCADTDKMFYLWVRPLQFNYLSYELFLEKKSCQTPKKKKKKVIVGVLRTKVVLNFLSDSKKKKKKRASFKNILCKCDSINYRKLSLL